MFDRSAGQTFHDIAEQMWIQYVQRDLPEQIANLNPYHDENGIIRSKGRFEYATKLTPDEKYPIVLPTNSYFTQLVIMHYHVRLYHVGVQQTLAEIRRRFWIPRGRQVVFNVPRKNCGQCRKLRNKPYRAPPVPPSPKSRLDPTTPFANSGVEILGPLYVKNSVADADVQKRWILLATCLVTRAVHLEIIGDMTTVEILSAFRMFFARSGTPVLILSDNAPQFKLFYDVYESNWLKAIKDPDCVSYFAQNCIAWKWIPQLSPWMGGSYERMVQLVKDCLRRTFHRITLTDRQLQVAVTEIEAVINSRPLTYIGPAIEDILTPNKFLQAHFTGIPSATTVDTTATAKQVQEVWQNADEHLLPFLGYFLYLVAISVLYVIATHH